MTEANLPTRTRAVLLAARPQGQAGPKHFELAEIDLPLQADGQLGENQLLVKNTVMSVDPYMRGRMNAGESYIPPFEVGQPLSGGAVGEVLASTCQEIPVGAHVLTFAGWREHALVDADSAQVVDTSAVPASAYLGALGMPGLTAWVGLNVIGQFKEGDAVFVSAAAGAVGSMVGQLAALSGASCVVGSAGGPEKVAAAKELGFDAVIDYKQGDLSAQLKEAAPEGIDVYFDNVGGDHLEAALNSMNREGRVALCGAIAQMNGDMDKAAVRNISLAIVKSLKLQGFTVGAYQQHLPQFLEQVLPWVQAGKITWNTTERQGLENAVEAFLDLFEGKNTGKMVVAL